MVRARNDAPERAHTLVDTAMAALLAVGLLRVLRRARGATGAPVAGADGDRSTPDAGGGAVDGDVNSVGRFQDLVDRTQKRVPPLAFVYAVIKKFGDDRAGKLAAIIAYYGFFSVFPLILVLVTVLRFVLEGHPGLRDDVLSSALTQVPVVGGELADEGISGNWWALSTGVLAALWAGMGALLAAQYGFNTVWGVPVTERPNFLTSRLRGLLLLVVVGGGLLATTAAQSLIAGLIEPGLTRLLLPLAVLALDVAVMALAFQVLTDMPLTLRAILPGALVAGTGYWGVQLLGTWYFERAVQGASDTYGTFAVVIGLLSWFHLLAQLLLLGAEVSVVWSRRLWPRSLSPRHPTRADREVYEAIAKSHERPAMASSAA